MNDVRKHSINYEGWNKCQLYVKAWNIRHMLLSISCFTPLPKAFSGHFFPWLSSFWCTSPTKDISPLSWQTLLKSIIMSTTLQPAYICKNSSPLRAVEHVSTVVFPVSFFSSDKCVSQRSSPPSSPGPAVWIMRSIKSGNHCTQEQKGLCGKRLMWLPISIITFWKDIVGLIYKYII